MFPTLLAEIEQIVPDKCNLLQESYNSFKVIGDSDFHTTYFSLYIYIYIYIERERERERHVCKLEGL